MSQTLLALTQQGFDYSVLAPYLETSESTEERAFPPLNKPFLQPFSKGHFQKLIAALELNSYAYTHVPCSILSNLKSLLHKYQHVFHLPNSLLSTIAGFSHNIPIGDSPPVYRLPYRKSPEELSAIKAEIECMLTLQIICPSNSAWGTPCILVCKPLEKGKPQPPRFVVHY